MSILSALTGVIWYKDTPEYQDKRTTDIKGFTSRKALTVQSKAVTDNGKTTLGFILSREILYEVKNAMKTAHYRSIFSYSNRIVSPLKAMFVHEIDISGFVRWTSGWIVVFPMNTLKIDILSKKHPHSRPVFKGVNARNRLPRLLNIPSALVGNPDPPARASVK
jgi:hypothetical protein